MGGGSPEQIEAMGHFGLAIGMAFQIVDDMLDIIGDERSLGKPHGIDFLDGKPTLPLMEAMKDPEVGPILSAMFVKQGKSLAEVEEALKLVRSTKALEESMKVARKFADQAIEHLEVLNGSAYTKSMAELVESVLDRKA
jgi:geranylgeranyl pyrophosphate synthase